MSPIPDPGASHDSGLPEDADIGTSSDDYARRFRGAVGRWFLETQTRLTLKLLCELPAGASILDVGGGHAQIAPPLVEAGYEVTVVGSDPICGVRLEPLTASGRYRFEVANLLALPYPDRSFDAVVCFRLLPHSVSWTALIGELCRVARRSVVLDYPSVRSVNLLSSRLFRAEKSDRAEYPGIHAFHSVRDPFGLQRARLHRPKRTATVPAPHGIAPVGQPVHPEPGG